MNTTALLKYTHTKKNNSNAVTLTKIKFIRRGTKLSKKIRIRTCILRPFVCLTDNWQKIYIYSVLGQVFLGNSLREAKRKMSNMFVPTLTAWLMNTEFSSSRQKLFPM